jgi:hypothetical protein
MWVWSLSFYQFRLDESFLLRHFILQLAGIFQVPEGGVFGTAKEKRYVSMRTIRRYMEAGMTR